MNIRTIFALPFKSNVLKVEDNGKSSLNKQSVSEHKVVAIVGNGLIIHCNHNFIVCNYVNTNCKQVNSLLKHVNRMSKCVITKSNGVITKDKIRNIFK